MANPLVSTALGFLAKLSFPRLFAITAAVFLFNLVVPDVIPFIDEIILGLGTLLLANLRKRQDEKPVNTQAPPPVAGRTIEGEALRHPPPRNDR
jgi:hypothetical protein